MAGVNKLACYSDPSDQYSHRVRLVLAEKGISAEIIDVQPSRIPRELGDINPYATMPTFLDRDLVLYEPGVILEYLEERYPHPPLLPGYPVDRANCRLLMYRIQRDWCSLADRLLGLAVAAADVERARKELRESLVGVSPLFQEKPFFLSEEITLVDCCLLPLLWRLPVMGVEIPKAAKPLLDYMERGFSRPAFAASLSKTEREMR